MRTRTRLSLAASLTGAILLGGLLGGCAVYPPYRAYYSGAVVVASPPPPAHVEIIGVAPWPGSVWISGAWEWDSRWIWRKGYWAKPPRPAAKWVPGRWAPVGSGHWRWDPGRWH